jgi:hypothetical protein
VTAATVAPIEDIQPRTLPYQPSWLDRLTHAVDQLPIPYWLFYLALAAGVSAIALAVQWVTGATHLFSPLLLLFSIGTLYVLCGIHYLDHLADNTLQKFRPVLSASDVEYADLRYRLTTLPPRTTLAVMALGIPFGMILDAMFPFTALLQDFQITNVPLSVYFLHALFLLDVPIAVLDWYHMLHQLRIVSEIHSRHTHIDLFNLNALYAFSNLTARSAIIYSLFTYGLVVASPALLALDVGRLWVAASILITGLVFVLPLWGLHRMLLIEKDRALLENSQRLKQSTDELHGRIKAGKYEGMGELQNALASLELERTALSRISTWPWHPETLRGIVGTLLLPLVIWLVQWGLEHVLKP